MTNFQTTKLAELRQQHQLKLEQYRATSAALRTELNPANVAVLRERMTLLENEIQALERELGTVPSIPVVTPTIPSKGLIGQIAAVLGSSTTQGLIGIISVILAVVALLMSQQQASPSPTPTVAPLVSVSAIRTEDFPSATATETLTPSATHTPAPPTHTPTETPAPPTAAPIIITATPIPTTASPIIITATPVPATNTPIVVTSAPAVKAYPCAATIVNPGSSTTLINTYQEASASASRGQSARVGDTVTIQRRSNDINQTAWYLIYKGTQRLGWISATYLVLSESCPS